MFMKRPENIIYYFICNISNNIVSFFVKPDMEVEIVTDLSEARLDKLKSNNIKGLIIDVDETLRFNMGDIPYENEEWLRMASDKLKIVILSNGMDRKLEYKFNEMNINYIQFAFKPLKCGFKKALDILGLEPQEVAVIGDDLFDDILGGNRNDMTTIKVSSNKKLVKNKQ